MPTSSKVSPCLIGGMLVFFLGLDAVGRLDQVLHRERRQAPHGPPPGYDELPWTAVFGGMWIVMIYYCGLNQFIVQRNLAAKSLKDGQLGMIFAGALWLLVPFAIVMPGIMAANFPGDKSRKNDAAYPHLIRELVGPGLRGFIFAAIAGAVVSTLASLLNSASTVASIDVYRACSRAMPRRNPTSSAWPRPHRRFRGDRLLTAPLLTDGVFPIHPAIPRLHLARRGRGIPRRVPVAEGSPACRRTPLLLGPVAYAFFQLATKQGLFAKVLGSAF
jgi:solute:Na+ symporter, SSS family